ncbi:hypothetical protein V2J09_000773 [Rumex salicifolius]
MSNQSRGSQSNYFGEATIDPRKNKNNWIMTAQEDDSEDERSIHRRLSASSSYVSIGAQSIQLEKMVVDIFALCEESKNQKATLKRMEKMIMEIQPN